MSRRRRPRAKRHAAKTSALAATRLTSPLVRRATVPTSPRPGVLLIDADRPGQPHRMRVERDPQWAARRAALAAVDPIRLVAAPTLAAVPMPTSTQELADLAQRLVDEELAVLGRADRFDVNNDGVPTTIVAGHSMFDWTPSWDSPSHWTGGLGGGAAVSVFGAARRMLREALADRVTA